ncbi:MAG: hypothetical protein QNI87_03430 [Erythrobacter sp.]|uniref:preATP grasp domain-containing protein n=1 Tax=Erythrobacter sp. TaxID=1042 RepID=UPI0026184267|nr:hypothetical protein [Erythrobacter sp.]MDJ0977564.1 hypothetical protein [Erythrobacter sp.]
MNVASHPPNQAVARRELVFHSDYEVAIDADDKEHTDLIAQQLLREEPGLDRAPPFGPLCSRGLVDAPLLVIEDHSGIQLAQERNSNRNLSYRAAMLASEGDLLVVYGKRDPDFERYCRDVLGLGSVTTMAPLIADPVQSLSKACLQDEAIVTKATGIAINAGRINLLPYMATGGVWRLAKTIAERARVPVHVAGPGPTLARAVNDKLWFAHCAALLLGRDAVPHNRTVYGMSSLVGHLRRFVKEHHVVGLKLPRSAASLGNMVLESAAFTELPAKAIAARLAEAINQRGWESPFPLQITAWEGPLLGSPSAQLWIPLSSKGPPIVEAVFDQATSGSVSRFVGGAPSTLGEQLRQRLAHEAALLGALIQRLGYFGRCSFDAVVVGDTEESARIHWVECNGRWGGMSIPMTLANRLVGNWRKHGFLVFSYLDPDGIPIAVPQLLKRCDDILFRQGKTSGIVLLTPGRLAYGGCDFLVIARDQATAEQLSEEAIKRLSALA